MAAIVAVMQLGDQLVISRNDGSQVLMVATGRGVWVPAGGAGATAQGAGESGGGATAGTTDTPPGSVSAPVDDYPWPDAAQDEYSPLRYSYRDCTDFVAWRINRDDGCVKAPWLHTWADLRWKNGDAIGWYDDWKHFGRGVDLAPAAGRIAWFGSSAGQYGHVAYVQSVTGDTVNLEEYNWGGTQDYGRRTIPASSVGSFLAIP